MPELDASLFQEAKDVLLEEFASIINLTIYSYKELISSHEFTGNENEDKLRNIMVKYLEINKTKFNLWYIGFETESGEFDTDFVTKGYVDIKVTNAALLFYKKNQREIYYAFECKKIKDDSQSVKNYVQEGINRFIVGKYSKKMPVAGMIGFVINGDINKIVERINLKLRNDNKIVTKEFLTPYMVVDSFNNCYKSIHDRKSLLSLLNLYHLMFDYSSVMNAT